MKQNEQEGVNLKECNCISNYRCVTSSKVLYRAMPPCLLVGQSLFRQIQFRAAAVGGINALQWRWGRNKHKIIVHQSTLSMSSSYPMSTAVKGLDVGGIYPPIATPFDSSENIAYDKLKDNMHIWSKVPFRGRFFTSISFQGSYYINYYFNQYSY